MNPYLNKKDAPPYIELNSQDQMLIDSMMFEEDFPQVLPFQENHFLKLFDEDAGLDAYHYEAFYTGEEHLFND